MDGWIKNGKVRGRITEDGALEVRCDGHGFVVCGRDFRVWDQRLDAALDAARLLQLPEPRGWTGPVRSTRPTMVACAI